VPITCIEKVRVFEIREQFQQIFMEGAFVSSWSNCTSQTYYLGFAI